MINHFCRWLLFTVILAPLPLVLLHAALWVFNFSPTHTTVLEDGELLAICCALAAAAIGDLTGTGSRFAKLKMVFVSICIAVLVVTTFFFVAIRVDILWDIPYDKKTIALGSVCCFLFTAVNAAICVGISHAKK